MRKNNIIYILTGIFIVSIIFSSCTIEKRKYMDGYFVTKNHKGRVKNKDISANNTIIDTQSIKKSYLMPPMPIKNNYGLSYKENRLLNIQEIIKTQNNFNKKADILNDSCAIIKLKNGGTIEAIILEISSTQIKYKKCNRTSSPVYIIENTEVYKIEYPDGEEDFIQSIEKEKEPEPEDNYQTQNYYTPPYIPNYQRENKDVNGGALASLIIGLLFLISGILVLLFLSILIGAIAAGLGLILLIVGAVLLKTPKRREYYMEKNNETIF